MGSFNFLKWVFTFIFLIQILPIQLFMKTAASSSLSESKESINGKVIRVAVFHVSSRFYVSYSIFLLVLT